VRSGGSEKKFFVTETPKMVKLGPSGLISYLRCKKMDQEATHRCRGWVVIRVFFMCHVAQGLLNLASGKKAQKENREEKSENTGRCTNKKCKTKKWLGDRHVKL